MKILFQKTILAVFLMSGVVGFASRTSGQGGVPLWTNRYPSGGGTAIAVDQSGNVFVTGSSMNAYTNYGFTTIKYSNTGVPLWTNRNGFQSVSDAAGIAVDRSGNVFVTGYSSDGSGQGKYVTIAYSNSGIPVWTNRYDGPPNGDDGALRIAADNHGNVFIAGYSSRVGGGWEYVTIKYANDGVPLWTNRLFEEYRYQFSGIAVDSSGNVFVTEGQETIGYSGAGTPLWTNFFDGVAIAIAADSSGSVFVAGASSNDYKTIKYSGAGLPLWTNWYRGPANTDDSVVAIAVDSSGNVFVTGTSWQPNGGRREYATIKYSGAGVSLWTNRYIGSGGNSIPTAIAVDSSGNVFVTGFSYGSGEANYATIAYSNSGISLWTKLYNGLGNDNDIPYAIAVDRIGNVFVTGSSTSANGFPDSDYLTIKYSSSIPPPRLDFQMLNNELVMSWTNAGFTLQSAWSISGTFTNTLGATSPYTNPISAPQQFFRLIGD